MEGKNCLVRLKGFIRFLVNRYGDGNFFVSNPITSKTNPVDIAASAALKAVSPSYSIYEISNGTTENKGKGDGWIELLAFYTAQ
jgi:hypothetical protein